MTLLAAFVAGGLCAMFIARALGRWIRRLFWFGATAVFGLWAFFVVGPALGMGSGSELRNSGSWAAWRGLLEVARSWLIDP